MGYYSAIKKNEIRPFAAIWMDLENVILSEVGQTEDKYHMTSPMESKKKRYKWTYLQNRKTCTDLEIELMVAQGKGQLRTLGR